MAFLLKVMPDALARGTAIVPRMKSAALVAGDIGQTVYVWLGNADGQGSALHSVTTLTGIAEILVPQHRDPSKKKHAYRLDLSPTEARVAQPLGTADLAPYRFVEGADGIESIGRIDRDRTDKIIRLSSAEADLLAERFRQ